MNKSTDFFSGDWQLFQDEQKVNSFFSYSCEIIALNYAVERINCHAKLFLLKLMAADECSCLKPLPIKMSNCLLKFDKLEDALISVAIMFDIIMHLKTKHTFHLVSNA